MIDFVAYVTLKFLNRNYYTVKSDVKADIFNIVKCITDLKYIQDIMN